MDSNDRSGYELGHDGRAEEMIATLARNEIVDGVGGDQKRAAQSSGASPGRDARGHPVTCTRATPEANHCAVNASELAASQHDDRDTIPDGTKRAQLEEDSDDDPISFRSDSPFPSVTSASDSDETQEEQLPTRTDSQNDLEKSRKNTKASLNIASENIRGRGAQNIGASLKWKKIAEDVRRDKIGLMAVQETHLTAEHVDEIHTLYKHLHVCNSSLPANPTSAGGVAIVFNKLLTNTERIVKKVLVPGCAIMAQFEWHRGKTLTVLAVYAPTDKPENEAFWEKLRSKLASEDYGLPTPEVLLGDFNFVEDSVDRYPAKLSNIDNPESFKGLKGLLKLKDGWRETMPNTTDWTWRDPRRLHMSRIDRIYLNGELLSGSRNWSIAQSGITKDDHSRIGATIYALDGPDVGPGRWAMKDTLTRDEAFLKKANKLLIDAEKEMLRIQDNGRTGEHNIQTVWATAKAEIKKAARYRTTEINCKRNQRITDLVAERTRVAQELVEAESAPEHEHLSEQLREVETKIHDEKARAHAKTFDLRSTRAWAEGETMSKAWFRWPTERKKNEGIPFLIKPGSAPPVIVENSAGMAETAREYHESIQLKDLDVDDDDRAAATRKALRAISARLRPEDCDSFAAKIDRDQVAESIRLSKNGKAAGTDGIIYELWKALDKKFRSQRGKSKEWVDIAAVLAHVFQDIEDFGVSENTCFTEGWMCPLYKKGERTDIANYRPITLLNTDYKLFTKALACKLAVAAQYLVHPSQAGFVRGRSITDHIKITMLMLDYAEACEEDGAIVALDQEKAYDRIRHDYLLTVLRHLKFPENFVSTVASLYENAWTRVMINGHLSEPYKVTRGVRQGDPLSCLLFNLAIEPLSALLRQSDLKGYNIAGLTEKLVATLYADDTTVYLAKDDSYQSLKVILDEWCLASGAKFNIKKTEVIPIGSAAHRAEVVESRRLNKEDPPLEPGIRIARDGEVTRILGAWPGNGVKSAAVWSKIEENIVDRLDRWERTKPTLAGRGTITQVVIGGCTQYLTAAQGMPMHVAKSLDSIAVNFFWQHAKRHPVNMDTLRLPRREGGMNLVHIQARNDAQYLTWVSAFLAPTNKRPLWTFLADGIFRARTINEHKVRVPEEQWGNPFCHDWRANTQALPFILQQMVRVAKKYQIAVDDPLIPSGMRERRPIWTHPALLDPKALEIGKMNLKCLRRKHAVRTVEDLEEIAELDDPDHDGSSECVCENCVTDRFEGCKDPSKCQEAAAELLSLISDRWNTASGSAEIDTDLWNTFHDNREHALDEGELLVFDHRIPRDSRLEDFCRVFVDTVAIRKAQASELVRREAGRRTRPAIQRDPITAVVAAGMAKDEHGRSKGGVAVHFPDGERFDVLRRCKGEPSFNQASATAVTVAATTVPKNRTLHIILSNRKVAKALTIDLDRNEHFGWMNMPGAADELRLATAALRARGAETTLLFIDRKRLKSWPEMATAHNLAQVAALCSDELAINDEGLYKFDRPGRSILELTQRQAHRAIRARTSLETGTRRVTEENLACIKSAAITEFGFAPTTGQIWKDLQDKCLSRTVRNFIWKGIHGAHKIGEYFAKMPEPWRSYADCPTCGTRETMEHILFSCPDSGQDTVWRMVRWLFNRKDIDTDVNIGTVWGCASHPPDGVSGRDRFFKMVVSEAAFFIWKIRCEKRIGHEDDPDWRLDSTAIYNRWKAHIKKRRKQDIRLTNSRIFGNRALDKALVAATWRDTQNVTYFELYKGRPIPGVLVGSGSHDSNGIG